jgi:hypothetical protein
MNPKIPILRLNFLLFLIGLGGAVYMKGYGTFAYSEPVLASMGLVLMLSRGIPKSLKNFLFVTLLWVTGIVLSGMYNQVDISNTIKLVGAVLLFYFDILSFYFLFRRVPEGAIYFVAGNMISYLIQFYYLPPPLVKEDFDNNFNDAEHVINTWIALTHYVAAISLSGILWFFGKMRLSILVMLIASAGALYLGSRAYFLTGFISSVLMCFAFFRPNVDGIFSRINLVKVLSLIALSTVAANSIYKEAAISGMLGEYAYYKYEVQSEVEGFGVSSGRMDFFVSLYAIARSPLLGYGANAPDNDGIQSDFYKLVGLNSMDVKADVPNHSHILGAWIWSGILSVPFWIFILQKIYNGFLSLRNHRLSCVCISYTIFALWHILFSPLAYRIDLCFLVGLFFALSYNQERILGIKSTAQQR